MLTPHVTPLPSDITPERIVSSLRALSYPFWLDSGSGAFGRIGRYSFMAAEPFAWLKVIGGRCHVWESGGSSERVIGGDPFAVLDEMLRRYPQRDEPSLPPFQGGAAGYFGYELGRFLERVATAQRNDWAMPEAYLGWYNAVVAWNHQTGEVQLITSGHPEGIQEASQQRAELWLERLQSSAAAAEFDDAAPVIVPDAELSSTFTRSEYCRMVERAQAYIAAGDIYQANVSQRFTLSIGVDALALYRRLRRISPAPFGAFLQLPEGAVASASPERFLWMRNGVVETRPIKGTRPRGATSDDDAQWRRELVESAKDRAEHVMIVDLERNDLGRVCRYGSVRVAESLTLESYANVHHLVSTVEGALRPECGPVDVLRAMFPGGSITGAPKIRAMQIIAELEPTWRNVYTGALGYLSFSGATDLSVVIRTLVVSGGEVRFQVGGGVVADSEPEREYQETLDKASGMLAALNFSEWKPDCRRGQGTGDGGQGTAAQTSLSRRKVQDGRLLSPSGYGSSPSLRGLDARHVPAG